MQSPTLLPGTFPPSPPFGPTRGRIPSASVQGRRSAAALGLGVSFAPLASNSTNIHNNSTPSPPVSRSHSRHSSISLSRRPSLSHLASFLSGIEHVTRVRQGGRGVSRSHSRAGGYRSPRTPTHLTSLVGGEEPFLDTAPNSPKGRAPSTTSTASGNITADIFDEGERVGVGVWLEGRGGWAKDCFNDGGAGPGEMEIVRRLGEGTYAIVYLVREVLYDPLAPNGEDDQDPLFPTGSITYGRNFALKCLCKKDLTDELIDVQRGEAVLHRALPEHENIVRLYGAYETDDWLFLVMEYCPGQDLYYWLDERADDSEALYDLHSRAASPFQSPPPPQQRTISGDSDDDDMARTYTPSSILDATPPSPSLLSSTANASLLSRRRLRLISRMFGQMCAAVQACHEVGISHRDIKPENFIVSDGRNEGTTKVMVKITDWGLGTMETECEDFDCGSKPYMAYECRNNLSPSYDPRQADVWSLGLVLLNLLYHRNPWADPSLSDPDFAAYVADARGFLEDRFEGIGNEVASFLADRVFCDVLEKEDDGSMRRRVSAGEFGRWASRLVMLMGEGKRKRASVSEATFPLAASLSRPGPLRSAYGPGTPSLLSQFAPSPASTSALDDLPADLRDELPSVSEEPSISDETESHTTSPFQHHRPPQIRGSYPTKPQPERRGTHHFEEDDEPLPSPSFPPLHLPDAEGQKSLFPDKATTVSPSSMGHSPLSPLSSPPLSPPRPSLRTSALSDPPPAKSSASNYDRRSPSTSGAVVASHASSETQTGREGDEDSAEVGEGNEGESQKDRERTKRRKRGARKGRASTTAPSSPPLSPRLAAVAESHDQTLADLAAASQDLARELSKGTSRSSHSYGTHSVPSFPSSKPPLISSKSATVKGSGGMFGKMRGLVMDGNQDLNALRQRAMERNADTYSAPAKMQGRGVTSGGGSGLSSQISNVSSQGSWSADDDRRGRSGGGHDAWSSASSRRERQQQQMRRVASPGSSVAAGTSSTSAMDSSTRNHTPLSSFSSVASGDWRNPSPQSQAIRPYSTSRSRTGTMLKDASTDTADLPVVLPPAIALPAPVVAAPSSASFTSTFITSTPRPSSISSQVTVESPSPAPVAARPPAPIPVPPQGKTKLAKMLNSISVFNRAQERPGS